MPCNFNGTWNITEYVNGGGTNSKDILAKDGQIIISDAWPGRASSTSPPTGS